MSTLEPGVESVPDADPEGLIGEPACGPKGRCGTDDELDELLEGILLNAPERFDGDAAAEAIAVDYVRWLEGERERCARHMETLAANYPPDVFPPSGTSSDAIGGTAMRHALANAARAIRAGEHEPA